MNTLLRPPRRSGVCRFLLPLLAVLTLVFTIVPARADTRTAFQEGVQLFNQGSYAEALTKFEAILAVRPNDVYSRSYANRCKAAIVAGASSSSAQLEKQLSEVLIPQVELNQAPLGDVLDYVRSRVEELSGGKTVVNFVFRGTPEQSQKTLVSLRLREIPAHELLRYIGRLANVKFTYETHAILVDPLAAAPATESTAESSGTES